MKLLIFLASLSPALFFADAAAQAQAPPREWVEKETGHRVIRLSGDEGGSSLYFHQNVYTPKGDKLIFDTRAGIAVVDVGKLGQPLVGTVRPTGEPVKAEVIAPEARAISMAWRTPDVYYRKSAENPAGGQRRDAGTLFATNVETKETREVTKARGSVINADETLIVGFENDPQA